MSYENRSITIIIVAIVFSIIFINSTFADDIRCSDVNSGNPNYFENMEKLAQKAGFSDNYIDKYQLEVVSSLCSGDTEDIDNLIDNGYVEANEVVSIAKVLGKTYEVKNRSEIGKNYEYTKNKFLEMGASNVCADNIAVYYTKKPDSLCGKLAKQALEGNLDAVRKLVEFPEYCDVNNMGKAMQEGTAPAPAAPPKTESVAPPKATTSAPSKSDCPTIKGFYIGMSIEEALSLMETKYRDIFGVGYKIHAAGEGTLYSISVGVEFIVVAGANKQVNSIFIDSRISDSLFGSYNLTEVEFVNKFMESYKIPKFKPYKGKDRFGDVEYGWEYTSPNGCSMQISNRKAVTLRQVAKRPEMKFD